MAVDVFISQEKIQKRVQELAQEIDQHYQGEELLIIGVLNGSFIFCGDLIRAMKTNCKIDFIQASSYGNGTESSGEVKIIKDISEKIAGRHCLLVEDIVDTGLTLSSLLDQLLQRGPKSLKLASLLYKPARLKYNIEIDFLAFEIEDKFVIGYGLDYAGDYRQLPYIGIYENDGH